MDPKLISLLRAFLGVDDKLLPDSMTTEELGKFIDDQKGKLFGNPEDFKNLQKILTKKDVDFQKTKTALEKLKSNKPDKKDDKEESEFEKLSKDLKTKLDDVTKKLEKIDQASETAKLQKEYPDILPELLAGKDEEQIKATVEKQRAMNKKIYGDSKHFSAPTYDDVKDVDKEIDEIKADKTISSEKQAVKIMQLGRVRENLQSSEPES